jgi:hypothetical protein
MQAYVKGIGNPELAVRPFFEEILQQLRQHLLDFPDRPAFVSFLLIKGTII